MYVHSHVHIHIRMQAIKIASTSIDVIPSKNQALCEFCTNVRKKVKTLLIL